MSLVVVDASAVVSHLLDPSDAFEAMAASSDLHTPALCDIELSSVLRRLLRSRRIDRARAAEALEDYLALPIRRHGHEALLGRLLELTDNFSAYDAAYVALAEALGAALFTGDAKLAGAARTHLRLTVHSAR